MFEGIPHKRSCGKPDKRRYWMGFYVREKAKKTGHCLVFLGLKTGKVEEFKEYSRVISINSLELFKKGERHHVIEDISNGRKIVKRFFRFLIAEYIDV
ncbi:MAG: hypothetical protein COB85_06375 [Bacteroidetes bacterium]|nr:MAG: hypothetical protein COB85_06375 [Bacteroidota bacterium]